MTTAMDPKENNIAVTHRGVGMTAKKYTRVSGSMAATNPRTPAIAPLAPMRSAGVPNTSATPTSANDAINADPRKRTMNLRAPITLSASGPNIAKTSEFTPRCRRPPWVKIDVNHVQTYSTCAEFSTNIENHSESSGDVPPNKKRATVWIRNHPHIMVRKVLVPSLASAGARNILRNLVGMAKARLSNFWSTGNL
jgi:hypothetical protein